MIALGWIFTEAFLWVLRKKNGLRRIPAYALQVTWIVLYAVVGGVNCVLAFWGIQFFRGSNRYSIFISTLALLFLVSRISHLSRRPGWSPVLNGTLAGFALLVGLFDQLPRQPELSATAALQKASESDRAFGEAMEKVLPPGAMVYELPVIGFPEDKPTLEVMPYDMMIPYLYTRTLRFSFGSVHGRPREDWQWEVEKMPAPEMVAALEKYGFSAIYLDRKGYPDKGNGLLKQLGATGRAKFIEDDLHEKVCVFLQPSPAPQFPQTDKRALVNFNSGWAQKEQNPATLRQWSTGNATLSFYNEQWETADFIFDCDLGSLSARHVAILVKGEKLWEGQLLPNRLFHVRFAVRGGHGMNQVKFETDEKPVEVKDARYALAFVVQDLHILKAE